MSLFGRSRSTEESTEQIQDGAIIYGVKREADDSYIAVHKTHRAATLDAERLSWKQHSPYFVVALAPVAFPDRKSARA